MYYEECSISNLDSLGTAISTGTINTNDTKVILAEDEFITATSDGDSKYYYIVLEYPNLEESQNSDIGGSFSGEVSVEENDAEPDINIIAAYIEQEDGTYEEVSDIPQEGYTINTEKSVCSNGAIPSWDLSNTRLNIDNLTKSGTSCYLYFDEYNPYAAKNYILTNKSISTRNNFSTILSTDTTGNIYQAEDDEGTTYYYAGAPRDNWLFFGGFYWRIIRINGDGTIRMIYQGTSANTTGTGTQIGTSAFNSSYNASYYVGLKYSTTQHGTSSNSTILNMLNSWYLNNLADYSKYIDPNTGFCGDREMASGYIWGPTTSSTFYYAPYERLGTNKTPSFRCTNSKDLYTISGSEQGNKALTYPIGLISADEVSYAGGVESIQNSSYYLYTGQDYWTMSPFYFLSTSWAYVYIVSGNGYIGSSNYGVLNTLGIRPVINLKGSLTLTGTGTTSDPYRVEGV